MNCITLLSDFGLHDASVASAKGILMQYMPHIPIIDISHLVEPFHLQQAAYLLASSYYNFPEKTCHVVLFDVFSEKESRLLLCEKDGHYFLAPDNGILHLAFNSDIEKVWNCDILNAEMGFNHWVRKVGAMLHQLQNNTPSDLGYASCALKNAPMNWQPRVEGNTVECHVIHIDRFENVVLNFTKRQFEEIGKGRPFRIQFMRNEEISEISMHYTQVAESNKLCRFNASGYLEIAINRGNAASLFGLRLHKEQHVMYNTIKIFFE